MGYSKEEIKVFRTALDDHLRDQASVDTIQRTHNSKNSKPRIKFRLLITGPKGSGKSRQIDKVLNSLDKYPKKEYKANSKNTKEVDFASEHFESYSEVVKKIKGYGDWKQTIMLMFTAIVVPIIAVGVGILARGSEGANFAILGAMIAIAILPIVLYSLFIFIMYRKFLSNNVIVLQNMNRLNSTMSGSITEVDIIAKMNADKNFKGINLIFETDKKVDDIIDPNFITHYYSTNLDATDMSKEIHEDTLKAFKKKEVKITKEQEKQLLAFYKKLIVNREYNLRKAKAEIIVSINNTFHKGKKADIVKNILALPTDTKK